MTWSECIGNVLLFLHVTSYVIWSLFTICSPCLYVYDSFLTFLSYGRAVCVTSDAVYFVSLMSNVITFITMIGIVSWNSVCPSEAMWRQVPWSSLVHVKTCCRLQHALKPQNIIQWHLHRNSRPSLDQKLLDGYSAPSHYLNQWWIIIKLPIGANFSEIWNKIQQFLFTKIKLHEPQSLNPTHHNISFLAVYM